MFTGANGVGKTTILNLLAQSTGWHIYFYTLNPVPVTDCLDEMSKFEEEDNELCSSQAKFVDHGLSYNVVCCLEYASISLTPSVIAWLVVLRKSV